MVFGFLLGILMFVMDNMIVVIVMGSIVVDFGSFDKFVWVMVFYMVVVMVGMLIYGKFFDMYGWKCFFLFGFIFFLIGLVLCGIV